MAAAQTPTPFSAVGAREEVFRASFEGFGTRHEEPEGIRQPADHIERETDCKLTREHSVDADDMRAVLAAGARVSAFDRGAFILGPLALLTTGLLAYYIPARRAMFTPP
jgi:hypothetical protein